MKPHSPQHRFLHSHKSLFNSSTTCSLSLLMCYWGWFMNSLVCVCMNSNTDWAQTISVCALWWALWAPEQPHTRRLPHAITLMSSRISHVTSQDTSCKTTLQRSRIIRRIRSHFIKNIINKRWINRCLTVKQCSCFINHSLRNCKGLYTSVVTYKH